MPPLPKPKVFIAHVGSAVINEGVKLATKLRRTGIGVLQASGSRSLKAQLRQANSFDAHYVVIIGEEELKTGTVILRDMTNAQQKTMPLNQLEGFLQ